MTREAHNDWFFKGTITVGTNATVVDYYSGTGSPEGVVTGAVGSIFSRTDGGSGTALYVKESGTGNTGWVAHGPTPVVVVPPGYVGEIPDDAPNDVYAPHIAPFPTVVASPLTQEDLGSFIVPTTGLLSLRSRSTLSSAVHVVVAGTGRIAVSDSLFDPSVLKYRAPGSTSVMPDEYITDWDRTDLRGTARRTMVGSARMQVMNVTPSPSRLVLAGGRT